MTRIEEIEVRRKTALPQILDPYQGDLKYLVIEDIPWLVKMEERMKGALEFYGDKQNWEREHHYTCSDIEDAEGGKARALLAELEAKP